MNLGCTIQSPVISQSAQQMSDLDIGEVPVSGASDGNSKASAGNAIWTREEELTLVQLLAERRAEAGDLMAFQRKTWTYVSEEMQKFPTAGAPKTWTVCKNKWGRVRWLAELIFRAALTAYLSRSRTISMSSTLFSIARQASPGTFK
jgi:hypothetical protein